MRARGRWLIGLAVALVLVPVMAASAQTRNLPDTTRACRSRDDCQPPLKGGLRIYFTGWACTSGFVARDPLTSGWYLITAGHCLADSGLLARWSHGTRDVGPAVGHAFRDGSNADVGAIEISEADAGSHALGSTSQEAVAVAGTSDNSSQTIGSQVCRSGATSGWTCGSIAAVDVDVKVRGTLIRHTWWTDFPSAPGDSGAPILDPESRVLGVLIATTPTQSIYSTIDWIATELALRPCVAGACD